MLELTGYLVCGLLIGAASLIGKRLTWQHVSFNLSLGLIGVLVVSLAPHLSAPETVVRAALNSNAVAALAFFLALLAGMVHLGVQVLTAEAPVEERPRLLRWGDRAVSIGAALLVVGLASAKLALLG